MDADGFLPVRNWFTFEDHPGCLLIKNERMKGNRIERSMSVMIATVIAKEFTNFNANI